VSKDALLGCLDAERASARLLEQGFHAFQHLVERPLFVMFFLIRHIVLDRLSIWFSSFEKPPSRALQEE